MNLISPTYGHVTVDEAAYIIRHRIETRPGDYRIVIGTDSQNFNDTKVVIVIAVQHIGRGGFFFYNIRHTRRIENVGQKLLYETHLSLECAEQLVEAFDHIKAETGFDIAQKAGMSIHVDAGLNGKSRRVIPEIVGWVHACGYDVVVKPDSYAASTIADRISK